MIFAYPLDFLPNSTAPVKPEVFEMAQKFCEQEFGERQNLNDGVKTWVVIKRTADEEKVIGVGTFRVALDIPRFHIKPADDEDEAGKQEARQARDALTARMWSFSQDKYGPEQDVFVYIDPKSERYWKSYLRMIRAKPAERYKLIV